MEQKAAQISIAHRLWAWFDDENNRKRALWGAVIVAGVGVVTGYYVWNQGKKEVEAGEALSQVMTTTIFSGGTRNAAPEAFLKLATEHAGTPAASQAALLAAGAYFSEGKFAEAQAQFQRFNREFPGNPFMSEAMLGTAASLEAQGKLDEAARAYKETSDRFAAANVAPPAKFALARIYESQNKPDQARSVYEEIMRSYPYHSLANEAAMRAEELKMKAPAPKPAPVAPIAPATPAVPSFQPTATNFPAANPIKP